MGEIRIIKTKIENQELQKIAQERFGDLVKAVVDIEKEIMAIGGELHADEEAILMEQERADRKDTWGINLYPYAVGEDFIEFDSMVNIKPSCGNRSRGVDDPMLQEKIKEIVKKLIKLS